jgi:hypothetical protein
MLETHVRDEAPVARDPAWPSKPPLRIDEEGKPLVLRIRNLGGGPAKKVSYYVVIGDQKADAYLLPDGFLPPARRALSRCNSRASISSSKPGSR